MKFLVSFIWVFSCIAGSDGHPPTSLSRAAPLTRSLRTAPGSCADQDAELLAAPDLLARLRSTPPAPRPPQRPPRDLSLGSASLTDLGGRTSRKSPGNCSSLDIALTI